ncbi:hypothetical protein [Nocardia niigatensis]|uniref:hypothetical protein n=1 Tax=Nocardia niigatensis TaxID=209249 RepID=UPI00030B1D1B|nr:hypothetical protein [Nocardia niigatensis]
MVGRRGELDAVTESLSQHEELAFVAVTTGRIGLIAEALCPDPAALQRYPTRSLGSFDVIHALEPLRWRRRSRRPRPGPAAPDTRKALSPSG